MPKEEVTAKILQSTSQIVGNHRSLPDTNTSHLATMSTLADELLNDFEDSGSEGEGEKEDGFLQDESVPLANGVEPTNGVKMDLDESDGDDDDEATAEAAGVKDLDDADDAEEAKAKVEKMDLHAVDDVRSVAGLMKTLEPVLEVSSPYHMFFAWLWFTSLAKYSPDVSRHPENISFPIAST